jgi:hypothetical protein
MPPKRHVDDESVSSTRSVMPMMAFIGVSRRRMAERRDAGAIAIGEVSLAARDPEHGSDGAAT